MVCTRLGWVPRLSQWMMYWFYLIGRSRAYMIRVLCCLGVQQALYLPSPLKTVVGTRDDKT